jgi:hypothetical protein
MRQIDDGRNIEGVLANEYSYTSVPPSLPPPLLPHQTTLHFPDVTMREHTELFV